MLDYFPPPTPHDFGIQNETLPKLFLCFLVRIDVFTLHTKLNDWLVMWTYTIRCYFLKQLSKMPPHASGEGQAHITQFRSYVDTRSQLGILLGERISN